MVYHYLFIVVFKHFKRKILCHYSKESYVMALGISILESVHLQVRNSALIFEIAASAP